LGILEKTWQVLESPEKLLKFEEAVGSKSCMQQALVNRLWAFCVTFYTYVEWSEY